MDKVNAGNTNDDAKTKTDIKKLCGAIGLARKAGAIIPGTESVVESVKKGKAVCVYISNDISAKTEKKLYDKTAFYRTPIKRLPLTMSELAGCIGYSSPAAAVALTNENFLVLIDKYLRKADEIESEAEV